jgi:tRNA(Ile)-lysidine synthase
LTKSKKAAILGTLFISVKQTIMFIQQAVNTIKKYNMLQPGEQVVIAVSGGADSVSLFYALLRIQPEWGLKLHVAHLNHMFRLEDAKHDAEFVRQLAQKHKLACSIERFDVPAYQRRHGLSPQAAARRIRYQFLNRVAEEIGAAKIALGHTADDQVETMLMRIIQGTGAHGLRGIPPRRKKYIRPLIETTRRQIEAYLEQEDISFRQDASNLSPKYLRNKIRLQLLPLLEREYNPNLREGLRQLAQILSAEEAWLEEYSRQILPRVTEQSASTVCLKLEAFNQQPLAVKRHILRWAVGQVKGDLNRINFTHVEQLLALAGTERGHKILHLPQQIVARKGYQTLELTRQTELGEPIHYDYALTVPGITAIPHLQLEIEARLLEHSELSTYPQGNEVALDWDKIRLPLSIRNRRPGDRFSPLGISGVQKLKTFFIDHKIPLSERDRIPLVVSGEEILWVAGLRINERYKIGSSTTQVLWLQLKEI